MRGAAVLGEGVRPPWRGDELIGPLDRGGEGRRLLVGFVQRRCWEGGVPRLERPERADGSRHSLGDLPRAKLLHTGGVPKLGRRGVQCPQPVEGALHGLFRFPDCGQAAVARPVRCAWPRHRRGRFGELARGGTRRRQQRTRGRRHNRHPLRARSGRSLRPWQWRYGMGAAARAAQHLPAVPGAVDLGLPPLPRRPALRPRGGQPGLLAGGTFRPLESADARAGAHAGAERHPRRDHHEGRRWRPEGPCHDLRPHPHLHFAAASLRWVASSLRMHFGVACGRGNLSACKLSPKECWQSTDRLMVWLRSRKRHGIQREK
mmetsp:Transcript_72656/g.224705  ORF Transcript_72656/g.224705 Transcript_72656/m.224705 type:complete len:318 (-) Transcript_72656:6-959(-)